MKKLLRYDVIILRRCTPIYLITGLVCRVVIKKISLFPENPRFLSPFLVPPSLATFPLECATRRSKHISDRRIIRNRSLTRVSSPHFCLLEIQAVSYSCRTGFRLSKINSLDYKNQTSLSTSERVELINMILGQFTRFLALVLSLVYIGIISTVMLM